MIEVETSEAICVGPAHTAPYWLADEVKGVYSEWDAQNFWDLFLLGNYRPVLVWDRNADAQEKSLRLQSRHSAQHTQHLTRVFRHPPVLSDVCPNGWEYRAPSSEDMIRSEDELEAVRMGINFNMKLSPGEQNEALSKAFLEKNRWVGWTVSDSYIPRVMYVREPSEQHFTSAKGYFSLDGGDFIQEKEPPDPILYMFRRRINVLDVYDVGARSLNRYVMLRNNGQRVVAMCLSLDRVEGYEVLLVWDTLDISNQNVLIRGPLLKEESLYRRLTLEGAWNLDMVVQVLLGYKVFMASKG